MVRTHSTLHSGPHNLCLSLPGIRLCLAGPSFLQLLSLCPGSFLLALKTVMWPHPIPPPPYTPDSSGMVI